MEQNEGETIESLKGKNDMSNANGSPVEEEEETGFLGCLIPGILIAILGSLFLLITALTRIKDLVLFRKPVAFMKAAIQKRRLQKRKHEEDTIAGD